MRGTSGAVTAVLLACAALTPAVAGSAPAPSAPPLIQNPDWVAKPSAEDMSRYFPPLAQAVGVDGQVVLECAIMVGGRVQGCAVLTERPLGLFYGAAAQRLSALFQMRPMTINGVPTAGARVRIPIAFRMSGGPPGAPPPASTEVSASALELGRRIVVALNEEDVFLAAGRRRLDLLKQANGDTRGLTAATIRARQTAFAAFEQGFIAAASTYVEERARGFARTFSEPDLIQMAAFFESPVGLNWAKRYSTMTQVRGGCERPTAPRRRRPASSSAPRFSVMPPRSRPPMSSGRPRGRTDASFPLTSALRA